jgi:hemerythrin superfamily protein
VKRLNPCHDRLQRSYPTKACAVVSSHAQGSESKITSPIVGKGFKLFKEKTMATASKTAAKTAAKTSAKTPIKAAAKTAPKKTATGKSAGPDATTLLRADHRLVSGLFDDFEKARSPAKKKAIVAQICAELTVHTQIEDEIFYPAFKAALKDHALVPEAHVEHSSVKDLIAQVEGVEPDGEMFDAKVKVMGEFVKHHVKEEQTQMFPKAKKSKLDLHELGRQMQARKQELMAERA